MPRARIAVFSALLVLAGCGSLTQRAQEPTTAPTLPVETSAPTTAVVVAPAALATTEAITAAVPAVRVSLPPPEPPTTVVPDWAQCPQYWQLALDVGWPEDQMPTVMYVMRRESGCNPSAHNPSGATGLMQLLGWSCPPNGCRDAESNLRRARELWESSGWCPWVLRGDPVTGRACG